MLDLAERYCSEIMVEAPVIAQCDISLSEALAKQEPEESAWLFTLLETKFPLLWQQLYPQIEDNHWVASAKEQQMRLVFSLIGVTDEEIRTINREFRNKDSATDVLTFTLLDDPETAAMGVIGMPERHLGEIYLSLPWAKAAVCNNSDNNSPETVKLEHDLSLYLLERMVHGCLHLLGIHHDTMADYNKVKRIQQLVVNAIA